MTDAEKLSYIEDNLHKFGYEENRRFAKKILEHYDQKGSLGGYSKWIDPMVSALFNGHRGFIKCQLYGARKNPLV